MMKRGIHYEQAFQHFLKDRNVNFIVIDQAKKASFAGAKIKSFDLIAYPPKGLPLLIDVKGRKLASARIEKYHLGQNWVGIEDVNGLRQWEQVFGPDYTGLFVFAYWIYDATPGLTGNGFYHYNERTYFFVSAELFGYQSRMKTRSQKWRTVFVPAGPFKELALPVETFFPI